MSFTRGKYDFVLDEDGNVAPIVANRNDYPGLLQILNLFKDDVKRVTSVEPDIFFDKLPETKEIILVGTLGKSKWIDMLVAQNKIDNGDIAGRWETSLIDESLRAWETVVSDNTVVHKTVHLIDKPCNHTLKFHVSII